MKFTVELSVLIGIILAIVRPKWLFYFLIFALLEPSRHLSLGNHVILGSVNIKFYEINLLLLYFAVIWNRRRTLKECIDVSLILFLCIASFSLLRGVFVYGETSFNMFRTYFAMGMAIAIPLYFKDIDEFMPMLRFFTWVIIIMGFIEFLDLNGVNPFSAWCHSPFRITSMLSATQGALLAMPFLYFTSMMRFFQGSRLLIFFATITSLGLSIASASRGVWVGITGSIAGMLYFMDFQKKILFATALVFIALTIAYISPRIYIDRYNMSLYDRFKTVTDVRFGTAGWRLDAWSQAVQDIKYHPFFGWPMGSPYTFYDYMSNNYERQAPHNEYLKIARYTGLIGLGFFMWYILSVFWRGIQYMHRHPHRIEYYMMLGFLACFLIHIITAMFTQAFTTMDRSPFVWAIPGIVKLLLLTEKSNMTPAVEPSSPNVT